MGEATLHVSRIDGLFTVVAIEIFRFAVKPRKLALSVTVPGAIAEKTPELLIVILDVSEDTQLPETREKKVPSEKKTPSVNSRELPWANVFACILSGPASGPPMLMLVGVAAFTTKL